MKCNTLQPHRRRRRYLLQAAYMTADKRASSKIHVTRYKQTAALLLSASPPDPTTLLLLGTLENPHLGPPIRQPHHTPSPHAQFPRILGIQQIILSPKRNIMRKEGIKVCLQGQMQDLCKVRVVDVREDSEELFVDVFCGRREGGLKISACWGKEAQL